MRQQSQDAMGATNFMPKPHDGFPPALRHSESFSSKFDPSAVPILNADLDPLALTFNRETLRQSMMENTQEQKSKLKHRVEDVYAKVMGMINERPKPVTQKPTYVYPSEQGQNPSAAKASNGGSNAVPPVKEQEMALQIRKLAPARDSSPISGLMGRKRQSSVLKVPNLGQPASHRAKTQSLFNKHMASQLSTSVSGRGIRNASMVISGVSSPRQLNIEGTQVQTRSTQNLVTDTPGGFLSSRYTKQ